MVRKRSEVQILLAAPQDMWDRDKEYERWGHPRSFCNHFFVKGYDDRATFPWVNHLFQATAFTRQIRDALLELSFTKIDDMPQ